METANDTSVTKFLDWGDTAVTNDNVNMTVIQFLADTLDENDISVTKFMDAQEDGIAVTKYLDSRTPTYNTVSNEDSANKRNVNMTII